MVSMRSLLQVIDSAMSLALCPQVVSELGCRIANSANVSDLNMTGV